MLLLYIAGCRHRQDLVLILKDLPIRYHPSLDVDFCLQKAEPVESCIPDLLGELVRLIYAVFKTILVVFYILDLRPTLSHINLKLLIPNVL
jgi:hypothetical protein